MMNFLPKTLGYVGGLFGLGSDASKKNPKASNTLAGLSVAVLGYWGIDQSDIAAVGSLFHKVGNFLGSVCGV